MAKKYVVTFNRQTFPAHSVIGSLPFKNLVSEFSVKTNFMGKAKKKKVLDSQATFCKNRWGRQVFFFYFLFPPKTNEATFFFFLTQSNLTLNLNANRSGKNVSYAFFLGWDSLGMQLELAWALCLGLEQASCSKLYVTPDVETQFWHRWGMLSK